MTQRGHGHSRARRSLPALLVGSIVLALVAGPAGAHEHNGNPAAPTHPIDGRHDVSVKSGGVEKTVSIIASKANPCSSKSTPYGPECLNPNADNGTTDGSMTITNGTDYFKQTDVGRSITGTNIPALTTVTSWLDSKSVTISAAAAAGTNATFVLEGYSRVTVSATNFNGTPSAGVDVRLCNAKVAGDPSVGGDGDVTHGCDFANSVTSALDVSGDVLSDTTLQMPSKDLLTQSGGPTSINTVPTATCPPTSTQIAAGWTCVIQVAQTDLAHVGYRVFNLKSPIPPKSCDVGVIDGVFTTCGMTIPPGQPVKLTGMRFPCKTIQPDDPSLVGNQGACLAAHSGKTILVKRVRTALIEFSITPTSQTAALNGAYTVTFPMPNLAFDGELYKLIAHAPTCTFNQGNAGYPSPDDWLVKSCESGLFNAAGALVIQ